jgi:molecular chaperone DnaK
MEKALKEHGDKVSKDDKGKIEKAIESLKKVKDGEDAAAIKREVEAVNQAMHAVSQQLYEAAAKAQQGQAGAPAGAEPPPQGAAGKPKDGGDEKIIDADFKTK